MYFESREFKNLKNMYYWNYLHHQEVPCWCGMKQISSNFFTYKPSERPKEIKVKIKTNSKPFYPNTLKCVCVCVCDKDKEIVKELRSKSTPVSISTTNWDKMQIMSRNLPSFPVQHWPKKMRLSLFSLSQVLSLFARE